MATLGVNNNHTKSIQWSCLNKWARHPIAMKTYQIILAALIIGAAITYITLLRGPLRYDYIPVSHDKAAGLYRVDRWTGDLHFSYFGGDWTRVENQE